MTTAQHLFQARYGDDSLPPPAVWSPVIEHLLGHRSVRHYLPDAVSDEQLAAIVAAAQSASSSSNLQAWSVVAVRDPARRAALAGFAGDQAHVREAPLQKVVLGLVSTKTPALEKKDALKKRIDEAAKFVPLEDLCLSPQCGFASSEVGNRLSEDDEKRKLELVVQVAREVWG